MSAPLVVIELGGVYFRVGEAASSLATCAPTVVRAPPLFSAALSGGLLAPTASGRPCAQALARVREELALAFASIFSRVLHLPASTSRVALLAPLALPEPLRRALLAALLADVGVAGAALLPAPLAAAVGAGCWTALVVDVGERCARVTPVVHGHALAHAAREAGAGAAALHALGCALALAAADAAAGADAAPLPAEGAPLPALAVGPLTTLHPAAASLALGRSAQPYGGAGAPWRAGLRDWELPALAAGGAALQARLRPRPMPLGGEDAGGAVALWVEQALSAAAARGGGGGEGGGALRVPLPPHVAAALALPAGATHLSLPAAPWAAAASGALLLCPHALAAAAAAAEAGLVGAGARGGHLGGARAALRAALAALREGGGDAPRASLPRAAAEALLASPLDARRALAGAVVACGGPASARGFPAALLSAVRAAVRGTPALAPLRALAGAEGGVAARESAAGAAPSEAAFIGGVLLAAALDAPGARGAPSPLARACLCSAPAAGVGLQWREEGEEGGVGSGAATAAAAAAVAPAAAAAAAASGGSAGQAAAPPVSSAAARLAAMSAGLEKARKAGKK